jgi:hypothetical protein
MSDKIRTIDGKKYYGRHDITSEDENEDFGFSEYKPDSKGSTDIEDFYYYLTNNVSPSSKTYDKTPSYTEMKKGLSDFINDKIDKEIEKLGVYSNYYTNKQPSDKYSKYLSTSTSPAKLKDLHTKEANKYKKQIRKLAKIYSDVNEALNKTNSDIIVSLYEKYIDPGFTNFKKAAMKEKAADQEEAYKQYEKGARVYLEDPEVRYPSTGIGKGGEIHEHQEHVKAIDASKPKTEEEEEPSVKKPQAIELRNDVFDWKYGNPHMERPKDLPDPEDRFKR